MPNEVRGARFPMTSDLFDDLADARAPRQEPIEPGAVVLRGFARAHDAVLMDGVRHVIGCAPLRRMVTPGGPRMSVAMSNCGALGWISTRAGYGYGALDPDSGEPWPPMPDAFSWLAAEAAAHAGFEGFVPDACLINHYGPGARLSLHQDRDERDARWPIVSVSLGLPAVFLFGGARRSDPARRIPLGHGDVVVWGGPARLYHHGVLALKAGWHPCTGGCRINLTFRRAR